MPGHVFWKDRNSCFLGCNSLHRKVLGVTTIEDVIGKYDYDFHNEELAAHYRQDDAYVMKNRKSISIEEAVETKSGNKEYWLTNKAPIINSTNEVIGVIGICLDITERKKLEQQLSKVKIELAIEKHKITSKELECIEHLLFGQTAAQTAKTLGISPRTAETHLENIKNKLGCFKKSELIATLIKLGFTPGVSVL